MKRILALLLVVCMVFTLVACSKQEEPAPTEPTEPTKVPLRYQHISIHPEFKDLTTYDEICEKVGVAWDSEVTPEPWLYYEDAVLGNDAVYHPVYSLGYDLSRFFYGEYGTSAYKQFSNFPTTALRLREDGTSYLMYDTETGYRIYAFVIYDKVMGYPIVINKSKMLSHTDFSGIQVGDSIDKVIAVDDVTSLYKKEFVDKIPQNFEPVTYGGSAVRYPRSSLHYLKDGLLQIAYTMTEDGNILIANISFYDDYTVPTIPTDDGQMTSHKIKDIDLPVN